MKKALIFWGGWDGHEPELVANRFARLLREGGVEAVVQNNMDGLNDEQLLLTYDLLVPCYTMSELPRDCSNAISAAVSKGVGMAGCHGGMNDAFRQDTNWQFITGGQWVAHPGNDGTDYEVNICHIAPRADGIDNGHYLTDGLADFPVKSEQYYLHVDPAVEVLATTRFPTVNGFHAMNKPVDMPVAWTKYWGLGRIFYCSLGHHDDVFDKSPIGEVLMKRGLLWAADSKEAAARFDLSRFSEPKRLI